MLNRKKNSIWIMTILIIALLVLSQVAVFAVEDQNQSNEQYYFNTLYKIKKDKGFSLDEKEKIKEKDAHYGWSLGSLYVNGYTQRTENSDGTPVFLKNEGDKVVLGFNLKQNINKLNGDETLSIAYDKKAYDDYFQIKKTEFKRGTLIVRHTDYQNNKKDPQVYTDYLSAEAEVNANTTVDVNEEGDYEVALDYTIKHAPRKAFGKEIFPSTSDYTIRLFKFSVRNGNSMVFPFDAMTGEELANKAFTENGFKIDLAKSHYLKVFVRRDIINGNEIQDTRENKPAKDGDVYTDEGIYTITVEDPSTGQFTEKKIYVGTEDRYKAYVTTGLSLKEIDMQLAEGAIVTEDGTLMMTSFEMPDTSETAPDEGQKSGFPVWPAFVIIIVIAILGVGIIKRRKIATSIDDELEDRD